MQMNLNKGCIEIEYNDEKLIKLNMMNLNKGCIEIRLNLWQLGHQKEDEP